MSDNRVNSKSSQLIAGDPYVPGVYRNDKTAPLNSEVSGKYRRNSYPTDILGFIEIAAVIVNSPEAGKYVNRFATGMSKSNRGATHSHYELFDFPTPCI